MMSMSEYIKHCRHFDGLGMGDAELESQAKALEAQVKQLEAALRHIAEGTWWDGNEEWAFHRVESYALAALQENE